MRFAFFYHSIVSCWNNGNAHFTRGIARSLMRQGHEVTVYEPWEGWSRRNLVADHGVEALREQERAVLDIPKHVYDPATIDLETVTADADVVMVHEWTDPVLVAQLNSQRRKGGHFLLLFHDTHHRGVSAPDEIDQLPLDAFDGVLAFGDALSQVYERRGWGRRAFTWHEAADTTVFQPISRSDRDTDAIWIGNWGDGERSDTLQEFLIDPAVDLSLKLTIHGVRYPTEVEQELSSRGIRYKGWLPNHRTPQEFGRARFTVHVPREAYATLLPGIPTIRVFEALACGIPLICAPWDDSEGLFPEGCYASVPDGEAMRRQMRQVMVDADYRQAMVAKGLEAIHTRHSCDHRARELLGIVAELQLPASSRRDDPRAEVREAVS